ncbi:unnamed protein product (macronuclear) [Paramecium tetraurelia]|uniref:Uncharacterized protein n=1 Tax=Paramecium tetraurelia TaxID=5888 RepID=A0E425_PARTE|nr:uncharacterized protein GSPATT00023215001 [Paramecium tetraurelia]CAK90042.1 unnamed protein product [Paramecium tetraurelia]|eukprot:XP_001457439.1 hypothetical protein (macronuclear) [Paramecium tetraurelia strain d4-2]
MQTYEFQLNNKRNLEREDLFILAIVERVLAGYLLSISYVDQAQFCDLLSRKQKEKRTIQPLHLQILGIIKQNLMKNQPPIKEQKVNYEVKRMFSQSIDSRKNYLCLSRKMNRNNKAKQISKVDTQQQFGKDEKYTLDQKSNQEGQRLFTNGSYHQNDSTTSRVIINSFQLNSRIKTSADEELKEMSIQKQLAGNQSNFKNRNQKPTINIVSQYGKIEKQENYAKLQERNYQTSFIDQSTKVNQNNENSVLKYNQSLLESQLNKNNEEIINDQSKTDNKILNGRGDPINTQNSQSNSKIQQQQLHGNDSSRIDFKDKLQQYNNNNDDDLSSQRIQLTLSDGLKQITYGTHTELSFLDTDPKQNKQSIQSAKYLDNNQEQQLQHNKLDNNRQSYQLDYKNSLDIQNNNLITPTTDEIKQHNNFLSPPQSSRTLQSGKSTKTKLRTLQSNEQKIEDLQHGQQISISREESQISLLDQSLNKQHYLHNHLNSNRPATTNVETNKQQDYPQFQTHGNIDQQQSLQLLQQISMTSIMHSDEHYPNLNQQMNIQVNQCEPAQSNVIIEESIECSPIQKIKNVQSITPSFNNQKSEEHSQQSSNQIQTQSKLQIQSSIQTPHSQQSGQFLINQTQQRMQIPNHNTQNSVKNNNKLTTKQKYQVREQQQQQRSDDSQPESKLTIESSQGEKSSRSKPVKNASQLKLHVAAAASLASTIKKNSNQNSPHDPTKLEQQEREKSKYMEYQKQIEKMKYERELMEQYQIPDDMPLSQKCAIIEELIQQLESNADQDVKYQIMLYRQRQEQLKNVAKQDIGFNRYYDNCYDELKHLSEQKLKVLGRDDLNKVSNLKFENQVQTTFPSQQQAYFQQDINSPVQKNLKFISKLDPVEIENQQNRIKEFKQETEILKFFQSFNSQYNKEVNQCDLDYPTEKDRQYAAEYQRGLLPKYTQKRNQITKQDKKQRMNTQKIDPKTLDMMLVANDKIKSVGQYLL